MEKESSTSSGEGSYRIRRALVQQPEPEFRAPIRAEADQSREHLIFLSHSGQEKEFVSRLDQRLRNAGHDPFFDIQSLPPGEYFPPHIVQNARECKLGVVVLSPGFLKSKWPMTELHIMHTSPSSPKILPVFFKIRPDDLKLSSPRFSEWQEAWKKIAEKDPLRVNISEWESAATQLPKRHGVVYHETQMSEGSLIEAVLLCICSIVRPLLRYSISHLTGHERLTQEVATLFEEMPKAPHLKAHVIGFYGIGGQGKTTICKLMVNHYASTYAGRCALLEFPSNESDEKEVARQCSNALQQLANSHATVDDFDQCLQLMKKQLTTQNVFIAIDNVWSKSLGLAQRILDVGFSTGSRILVTSRSREVLSNLLKGEMCVRPLPNMNDEEARQIFIKSFDRNQVGHQLRAGIELEDSDVDGVMESYGLKGRVKDGYHPLAINALGVSLGRTAADQWLVAQKHMHLTGSDDDDDADKVIKINFDSIPKIGRDLFLSRRLTGSDDDVDKVIKINFDSIPKIRRDMFLDVALIYISEIQENVMYDMSFDMFQHAPEDHFPHDYSDLLLAWLSALYIGRDMDEHKISMALTELAYDGLLEFGSGVWVKWLGPCA